MLPTVQRYYLKKKKNCLGLPPFPAITHPPEATVLCLYFRQSGQNSKVKSFSSNMVSPLLIQVFRVSIRTAGKLLSGHDVPFWPIELALLICHISRVRHLIRIQWRETSVETLRSRFLSFPPFIFLAMFPFAISCHFYASLDLLKKDWLNGEVYINFQWSQGQFLVSQKTFCN